MKQNEMQLNSVRLVYEEPSVEFVRWENDVLAADNSMEVGGEYNPEIWG